jgi:hypothetical protein
MFRNGRHPLLILATALLCGLTGCQSATHPTAQPANQAQSLHQASNQQVYSLQAQGGLPQPLQSPVLSPLTRTDLPAFVTALRKTLPYTSDSFTQFRILTMRSTPHLSYILYHLPGHEGLSIACKEQNHIRIVQPLLPLKLTDNENDLVSFRAIPAGTLPENSYGVLYGIVNSPYITQIEARYRDSVVEHADVAHSRGFIFIRKDQDPRFVQINALGKGGLWWTKDTR